jgi:hypothetical protein
MNYIFNIFVFVIVLFLYIHIQFQLKTSNDLEVYNIEKPSKDKLEEICDIRQPLVYYFNNEELNSVLNIENLKNTNGIFDVKVRNKENNDPDSELYLPFAFNEASKLFEADENKRYFSEKNNEFINETGISKILKQNDSFLRPSMVSKCLYDIMLGSKDCCTPLRYNLNYRNYFYVTSDSVNLKLIPPDSTKFLYCNKDYDNFEFNSPINPWEIQDEFKKEFQKVKALDIVLKKGEIIYIPAYWWYSIKYNTSDTVLCNFSYRTFMNTVSILPDLVIWFLQNQNIKFETVKKMSK